jgi:predicted membrane protein
LFFLQYICLLCWSCDSSSCLLLHPPISSLFIQRVIDIIHTFFVVVVVLVRLSCLHFLSSPLLSSPLVISSHLISSHLIWSDLLSTSFHLSLSLFLSFSLSVTHSFTHSLSAACVIIYYHLNEIWMEWARKNEWNEWRNEWMKAWMNIEKKK